jgi:hypothetical protein
MDDSFETLRAANPRTGAAHAKSVEAVAQDVRSRLGHVDVPQKTRRRGVGLAALAAAAAAAAVAVVLSMAGSHGGVSTARAAVDRAAVLTAASAQRSGTAIMRITHDGQPWAGAMVRWRGDDLSVSQPDRSGGELRVVDGMMYGVDPEDGAWMELGPPSSIDPGSGTTPADYLAAVREDIGGATLLRITHAMIGLTSTQAGDGSRVYRGTVAARLVARRTGFKEGRHLRVFPFGYVAHDQAADPASQLDAAVTVGADGIYRAIVVTWGSWRYEVAYSGLGSTAAPAKPVDAKPLKRG